MTFQQDPRLLRRLNGQCHTVVATVLQEQYEWLKSMDCSASEYIRMLIQRDIDSFDAEMELKLQAS